MPIWAQIIVPIAVAGGTLIVTTIVNYMLGGPKRARARREEREKAFGEKLENEHNDVMQKLDDLKDYIDSKLVQQDLQRDQLHEDTQLLKLGTQAMLKNDLKLRYESWLSKSYAPMDAKDDLEKMYQVYHRLGANGVMDGLRRDFLELPDERVVKNKKKNAAKDLEYEDKA